MTRKILAFIILAALLGIAQATAAHGYIVRSIPQDRVVLERPPTRLQYWFSESLEPQFSTIHLRNQSGEIIATGGVDAEDDRLLSLRVPGDLVNGAYLAELRIAFASDAHVIVESRVFFVGVDDGSFRGESAANTARPLEVIWKALLYHATYLMFGASAVYAYVLVPVWGNARYPQGLLPPRVMHRLNWLMGIGLAFAVAANILALMQQTIIFFNVDWLTVLRGGLWQIVRVGSRFGDVWHFRMFMLLIIGILYGAGLYYGRTYPKVVRSFWTANVWALVLLIGAQAVTSHASGSLIMPWVALFVHWLHTVAVGFWIGGIAALTLILPVALEPYEHDIRWQALHPVMQRFSRYVVGAVLVVITSGIYSATNWFYTSSDLGTSYGATLAYKLVMVVLLLFVGLLHHIALRPHLLQYFPVRQFITWAQGFRGSLWLETAFVVAVLVLSSLLSATPIPEPEFLQQTVETPSSTQQVGEYSIQMTIAPGGTGINTVDIVLERESQPVNDATVEVQIVAPERPIRSSWMSAEFAENGLYVVASDVINQNGNWQTLVDILDSDGNFTRTAFAWEISDTASVIQSRPPSLLNIIALIAVIVAVAYTLYPSIRWLANQLQWTRVNVVVSGGLILMTILMMWLSIVALERQRAASQLVLNPPPQIVNTVLPDMASIEQGETLYQAYCSGWQESEDLEGLINRLELMRDDELYAVIENGWRSLPACDSALSETERWHIVNYVRTLR
jgi:putative copper export protein/methionine-rich copper-binding protein CopC